MYFTQTFINTFLLVTQSYCCHFVLQCSLVLVLNLLVYYYTTRFKIAEIIQTHYSIVNTFDCKGNV